MEIGEKSQRCQFTPLALKLLCKKLDDFPIPVDLKDWDFLEDKLEPVIKALPVRDRFGCKSDNLRNMFKARTGGATRAGLRKPLCFILGITKEEYREQYQFDERYIVPVPSKEPEIDKAPQEEQSLPNRMNAVPIREYFDLHPTFRDASDVFEQRYYPRFFQQRVVQVIEQFGRCLLIGGIGAGKSALLEGLGRSGVEGTHTMLYLSLKGDRIIDESILFRELEYARYHGIWYVVDDCHDNPDVADTILNYSQKHTDLLLLLSSSDMTRIPSLTRYRYMTAFEETQRITLTLDTNEVEAIVEAYADCYAALEILPYHADRLVEATDGNLRLVTSLLDTWRQQEFQISIDAIDLHHGSQVLVEDYLGTDPDADLIDAFFPIAVLSQFDMVLYDFPDMMSRKHFNYFKRHRHVEVGSLPDYANHLNYFMLSHASTARLLVEGIWATGHFRGESLYNIQSQILQQYLPLLAHHGIPVVIKDFFELFSKLAVGLDTSIRSRLLSTSNIRGAYMHILSHIQSNYFNKDWVEPLLRPLMQFLIVSSQLLKPERNTFRQVAIEKLGYSRLGGMSTRYSENTPMLLQYIDALQVYSEDHLQEFLLAWPWGDIAREPGLTADRFLDIMSRLLAHLDQLKATDAIQRAILERVFESIHFDNLKLQTWAVQHTNAIEVKELQRIFQKVYPNKELQKRDLDLIAIRSRAEDSP